MASKQVDGLSEADAVQINSMKAFPHVAVYKVETTQTIVARMHPEVEQFKDKRVRQALRHAIDRDKIIQTVLLGAGTPAEDHHVAPSHPEYAALPKYGRDIDKAKKLLADAGYPNGFEYDMVTRPDPIWELNTAQAVAEQFKDIGVKVNIKSLPSAAVLGGVDRGSLQPDRMGPSPACDHDAWPRLSARTRHGTNPTSIILSSIAC